MGTAPPPPPPPPPPRGGGGGGPPPPPPQRGGGGGVAIYKQGAVLYYYKVGGCVNQIDTSLSIYYKRPYLQYFHKLATSQDQSHFVLYKDNWYPI